jgi:hypothetical protein
MFGRFLNPPPMKLLNNKDAHGSVRIFLTIDFTMTWGSDNKLKIYL